MYENPILIDQASKALLGMSVWNDSLFLSNLNVMDYSLIVGVEANGSLVCGVIGMFRSLFVGSILFKRLSAALYLG